MNALIERPEARARISPGFYFQRSLALWKPGLREIDKERKAVAVEPLEGLGGATVVGDVELHEALLHRQARAFTALCERFDGIEWRLRSITPFVTGIGSPHPLENGFAFLKPYGVPYLAASGLKGAVRAACAAAWKELGDARSRDLLRHYFGSDDKRPARGEGEGHRRGALMFLDLLPEPSASKGKDSRSLFRLDVVNPHYGPYYQGKDVPADWHSPVPSYFLTLRADLDWRLRIIYAPSHGEAHESWVDEIALGLELALTETGLGAKKAWGYGLFAIESRTGVPAGQAQTDISESVRPETLPAMAPQKSAAARALVSMLPGLRANRVRPALSELEQNLRAATAEERVELFQQIEQRFVELRLPKKDMNDLMKRLHAVVAPSGE